jgi:hypothetical protein
VRLEGLLLGRLVLDAEIDDAGVRAAEQLEDCWP